MIGRSPTCLLLGLALTVPLAASFAEEPARAAPAPRSRLELPPPDEYVVREGDTLSAIAMELLGSASRWTEIASANGIRDPSRLAIGTRLRIPASKLEQPPRPDAPTGGVKG